MSSPVLREESPRWLSIMGYLQEHGGVTPEGLRIKIPDLAAALEMPDRTVKEYLLRMEALGVIKTVRTSVDGTFGSPRGPNIYHLNCSVEAWRDELGPQVAQSRRDRTARTMEAKRRVRAGERERKRAGRMDGSVLRQVAVPTPPRPEDATIELLAQEFLAEDDLAGW